MLSFFRIGDDERTQRIFELVKHKVIQGRSPEVAARMVYLAVTHWDEINSSASLEKALGSLRPLLRYLPPNYSTYHHHGPGNSYFFYPLRGLDALFATLGLEKQKLDVDRIQEGRDYAGRILSVYPELLSIDSTLPATASAVRRNEDERRSRVQCSVFNHGTLRNLVFAKTNSNASNPKAASSGHWKSGR